MLRGRGEETPRRNAERRACNRSAVHSAALHLSPTARRPLPDATPSLNDGPPPAGFALTLSGIMDTYYQPDPEDVKAGGQ